MKIQSEYVLCVSSMFCLGMWGCLLWKMKFWIKIMDLFREGVPFERALESLKQGKSIRRKKSNYGLTKIIVSARGEHTEKFCEFDIQKKEKLKENPILNMEDILANDWVIEDN